MFDTLMGGDEEEEQQQQKPGAGGGMDAAGQDKIAQLESQVEKLSATVEALSTQLLSTKRDDGATVAQLTRIEQLLIQVVPSKQAKAEEAAPAEPEPPSAPSQAALDRLALAKARAQVQQPYAARVAGPAAAAPTPLASAPSEHTQAPDDHIDDNRTGPAAMRHASGPADVAASDGRPDDDVAEEEELMGVPDDAEDEVADELDFGGVDEEVVDDDAPPAVGDDGIADEVDVAAADEAGYGYDEDGFEEEVGNDDDETRGAPAGAKTKEKQTNAAVEVTSPQEAPHIAPWSSPKVVKSPTAAPASNTQSPAPAASPVAAPPAPQVRRPAAGAPHVVVRAQAHQPAWEVRSPAERRGIPEYCAESDPHLVGYFSRPATSLIQMLLSTRARRRQIRSQMRSEREAQALSQPASAHLHRLSKLSQMDADQIHGQTLVLPDGAVRA